ncbi:MAG: hypothetical protein QFX32_02735 [Methanolinea sp.]|nr:hypothetical protein [Methanolinea sp.]
MKSIRYDGFWKVLLPWVAIAALVILPAAGNDQGHAPGENLMSSPDPSQPVPHDTPPADNTLAAGGESPDRGSQNTAMSSLLSPSASGTVSAWISQRSSTGPTGTGRSTVEYRQVVSASGKILKFAFSAHVAL